MPVPSESAGEMVPGTPTIVRHPRLGSGTQSRSRSLVDAWESLDGPHRGSFSMEVAAQGKKGSLYEHSPSRRSFDDRPPSSVDAEAVIPVAYPHVPRLPSTIRSPPAIEPFIPYVPSRCPSVVSSVRSVHVRPSSPVIVEVVMPVASPYVPQPPSNEDEKMCSSGLNSLPFVNPSRPDAVRTLDTTFDEREKQRRNTFLQDEQNRYTFFGRVKEYIEGAGPKRQLQFKGLEDHLEVCFSWILEHFSELAGSRIAEYDAAESHRDQTFADSEVHMKETFDNLLSLIEEQSRSLEIVQDQHGDRCYKEVEGLLSAMNDIVEQTRMAFVAYFSESLVQGDDTPHTPQPHPAIIIPPEYPSSGFLSHYEERFQSRSPRRYAAEIHIERSSYPSRPRPPRSPDTHNPFVRLYIPAMMLQVLISH